MTLRFAWKFLAVAATCCATLMTLSSQAAAGPVNRALTGGLIDPYATTLRVVPPKGGMVMLHQNGRAVAWFTQAGLVNLAPNMVYGIAATRGTSMLFNANIVMRQGYTQAVWGAGNQPQLSYQPTAGYRAPAAGRSTTRRSTTRRSTTRRSTTRRSTTSRTRTTARSTTSRTRTTAASTTATSPARLTRSRHQALLGELRGLPTDRARWNLMKSTNKRYALSVTQKRAIVATFAAVDYRRAAEHTMSLTPAKATTKNTAKKTPAPTVKGRRPATAKSTRPALKRLGT